MNLHAIVCSINFVHICDHITAIKTANPTIAASDTSTLVTHFAEVTPRLWQSPHQLIAAQCHYLQLHRQCKHSSGTSMTQNSRKADAQQVATVVCELLRDIAPAVVLVPEAQWYGGMTYGHAHSGHQLSAVFKL